MIKWTITAYSQTNPIIGNGLSAYEVAVKNGYVGSESQWLLSLQGSSASGFNFLATRDTSGHKVLLNSGEYADCSTLLSSDKIIGISTNAALTGNILSIKANGTVTEPSWNWDITKNIYLGTNGSLVQNLPISGVIVEIAKPLSNTEILVNISPLLVL